MALMPRTGSRVFGSGVFLGIAGSSLDITERKQAEK
jgi:PAS domain-containing protein